MKYSKEESEFKQCPANKPVRLSTLLSQQDIVKINENSKKCPFEKSGFSKFVKSAPKGNPLKIEKTVDFTEKDHVITEKDKRHPIVRSNTINNIISKKRDTILNNQISQEFINLKVEADPNKAPFDKEKLMKHFWENGEMKCKMRENEENYLSKIGANNLTQIFNDFERKIEGIPQLSQYFEKLDLNKIFQGKLEFFKKELLKGDIEQLDYHSQVSLETMHKKLNITNDDFNTFKGFFAIYFKKHEVDCELTGVFLKLIEKFRKFIVFEQTIFQKILETNQDLESQITDSLIDNINHSHMLRSYFESIPTYYQKKHCKFIYNSLMKEDLNNLTYIRKIHENLQITEHLFYLYKICFLNALKQNGISSENIIHIEEKFEFFRDDVINTQSLTDMLTKQMTFNEIVTELTHYITKNSDLLHVFKGLSEEKLRKHTEIMLIFLWKGNSKYIESDLTPTHFNVSLTTKHFQAMRDCYEKVLKKLKLNESQLNYLLVDYDYYKYYLCNETSLLKKLGGPSKVNYLINCFYLKTFQDPLTKNYFRNAEPTKMIENQSCWFSKYFSNKGMKSFHFKDIRFFHLGLKIDSKSFDAFVKNLTETLGELEIKDSEIEKEIVQMMAKCKLDVIGGSIISKD